MKKVLHFAVCVFMLFVSTAFSYGQTCNGNTFTSPGQPTTCTYTYTATGWEDSSGNPIATPTGLSSSTESICILADNNINNFGVIKGTFYVASGITYSGSVSTISGVLVVEGTLDITNTPSVSGADIYTDTNGILNIAGNFSPGGNMTIHNAGAFNIGGDLTPGGGVDIINYDNAEIIVQGSVNTNSTFLNCGLLEVVTGSFTGGGGSGLQNLCTLYIHNNLTLSSAFNNEGLLIVDGNLDFNGSTLTNEDVIFANNLVMNNDNLIGNDDTSILIVRNNAELQSGSNITGHYYFDIDDGGGFDSVCGSCTEDIDILDDVYVPSSIIDITTDCGNNIIINPLEPIASIDFDGVDDYISTPSFASGIPAATLMAWVKLDPTFSAAGEIAGHPMMRMYVDSAGRLRSYYITSAGNSAYGSSDPGVFVKDQWYHVALSYQGTTGAAKIYVNGELVSNSTIPTGTLSTNPTYTSHDFNIGRRSRFSNTYFNGAIDEVRFFNMALSDEQIQRIVYQEIELDGTGIKGKVLPNNIDEDLPDTVAWSNLLAYYPMTDIISQSRTEDYSSYDRKATLNNITTIQKQTAPMPYETTADGDWSAEATWLHGDVWDIEDEPNNKDWSIVKVHHNLSTSKSHTTLGLFIDSTKTLSVNGDNAITNNWYLELNGTLDLADDSQLIQGTNSDLVTSATGKILRRQEGHSNVYWYNYWSSPTGALNATSLLDNNAATNNPNNTPYSVKMLKQDDGSDVLFTTAFSPPLTNPVTLSSKWLYTFQNGLNYYDWTALDQNTAIAPGLGYTQKGTGNAGPLQQYIFDGKPNNGTILVSAIDTGGPGSVEEVSKTTTFIGNPYPSALDARQFINDNSSVIEGTIKLWEQWAGNSHWLSEYEGGYGYINLLTTERAYQYPGIPIAGQVQTQGIKVPSFYLPVGQAFFVEVITDGDIVFNNGQRVFKKEADSGADPEDGSVFFAPVPNDDDDSSLLDASEALLLEEEQKPIQLIRLEFKASNGASRRFVLGFGEQTTDDYDYGYDGGVIDNIPDEDMASLFNGQSYVLQAFSTITPEKVVDLSFKASGNYNYSIEIAELAHVDDSQQIFIKDHQENSIWDLRQGAYNFSALEGKDDDRFDIVFKSEERPSSNEQAINEPVITIMEFDNKLFVKGLTEQVSSLTLKNMLGQTIKTFNNPENQDLENGLHLGDLSSGVYLVNLITDNNLKLNKKIILK